MPKSKFVRCNCYMQNKVRLYLLYKKSYRPLINLTVRSDCFAHLITEFSGNISRSFLIIVTVTRDVCVTFIYIYFLRASWHFTADLHLFNCIFHILHLSLFLFPLLAVCLGRRTTPLMGSRMTLFPLT